MTPEEFEQHIADLFYNMSYEIKLTPKSYDYGVDIIATNQDEKIAIQVKMYESRSVNYKDIMYLYAGREYYDCNKGLLITTGYCDKLAVAVAEKLKIEIEENFKPTKVQTILKIETVPIIDIGFDNVWENHIKPLKGRTVFTVRGEENKIIDVNDDFLQRKSSNDVISKIEKNIFKTVYYRLKKNKSITREEINTEYPGRGSSIIIAVFGQLTFITLTAKPKAKLTLRSDELTSSTTSILE